MSLQIFGSEPAVNPTPKSPFPTGQFVPDWTPGYFLHSPDFDELDGECVTTAAGVHIADAYHCEDADTETCCAHPKTRKEASANARLMAASKALWEALDCAQDYIKYECGDNTQRYQYVKKWVPLLNKFYPNTRNMRYNDGYLLNCFAQLVDRLRLNALALAEGRDFADFEHYHQEPGVPRITEGLLDSSDKKLVTISREDTGVSVYEKPDGSRYCVARIAPDLEVDAVFVLPANMEPSDAFTRYMNLNFKDDPDAYTCR